MFEAIIGRRALEAFTEPISAVVDECEIQLTADGIAVAAVDAANVAMVDIELHPDVFETYDADGAAIGVDIERLEDVIGFADKDELIRLAIDDGTRRLNLSFDRVSYDLGLIDPGSIRGVPNMPDIEFPAAVGIGASELQRAVRLADMTADHLTITVNEPQDVFGLRASGDVDDVYIEYSRDDLSTLTAADVRSIYTLDYLADMTGVMPSDADVHIEIGDQTPVAMNYQIADGDGGCRFVLSPRIKTEGDD